MEIDFLSCKRLREKLNKILEVKIFSTPTFFHQLQQGHFVLWGTISFQFLQRIRSACHIVLEPL